MLVALAMLAPPPEGFRESVRLTPIAAALAGKPVAVHCATTDAAWAALLKPYDYPADVDAITIFSYDTSYLSPVTCRRLEGWLRGKNAPTAAQLGIVVLSLTHEAMHLRGILDERGAECGAMARLRSVLRVHFKIRRETTMRVALSAARALHNMKPAAYQGC